jgi:flagellar protein FlgJ
MNFAIGETGRLSASASATSPASASAEHRKLTAAAQQFEGLLLQEMLKPMKEHGFCQEDRDDGDVDKDSGGGFADTLSSYGTEALATAIAKGGGLGVARRVVAQVESERDSRAGVAAARK